MWTEADRACAAAADAQKGAFHREQALRAGHTRASVAHRLSVGAWVVVHPNVYAFAGAPRTWEMEQMSACLWSGGVAYGTAAGRLWGLPGCEDPRVEVLTARRRPMAHSGVTVHFTTRLPPEQATVVGGIPVASIERTLLGLSAAWPENRVAIALDDALVRDLTDVDRIDAFLARTARRGRGGVRRLRRLAQDRADGRVAPNSALESVIFQLIVEYGMPPPERQYVVRDARGAFVARVDFFYPPDLVIEGQSDRWHRSADGWRRDVERFNNLQALGLRVLQVTWDDATRRRAETAHRMFSMLPGIARSVHADRAPREAVLAENG